MKGKRIRNGGLRTSLNCQIEDFIHPLFIKQRTEFKNSVLVLEKDFEFSNRNKHLGAIPKQTSFLVEFRSTRTLGSVPIAPQDSL